MSNELKIVFDSLPPAELMPNRLRRLHWAVRARVEKQARIDAMMLAYAALYKADWQMATKAEIAYMFYVKDRRRRDIEGMIGACKAWVDGLVDAGVIEDDSWQHLSLGRAEVVKDGQVRTEIVIRRIEAQR
jgi:crossover junction endodeoxyribonuclease RusA